MPEAEAVKPDEGHDNPGGSGRLAAMNKAAETPPDQIDGQTRDDATAWFLSDEVESVASDEIDLNVGGTIGSGREKWVRFRVQVVPGGRERIRDIRRECMVTNAAGEREVDDTEANAKIAAEGLLTPDLSKSENRRVRGQDYFDPVDALNARFAHKPGLIDQLANKIVAITGYDDKDVREVKAAGN